MARKKAPPKRAPEYVAKKKSPPGKAKDGSKCYTRKNSSGGSYVICEGSEKKAKARAALKRTGSAPPMRKKPKGRPRSISKGEFNQARSNLTKTMARKPGTKPKPARSVGSYADSDATRRSTRPVGEGGFAKRTGGAPGRFTSNPTGNKPHGMSMDEWRSRPSYKAGGYQGPREGQSEASAIHGYLSQQQREHSDFHGVNI